MDAFQGNFDYSALFAIILTFLVFCKIKNFVVVDDDDDDDDDDDNWGFGVFEALFTIYIKTLNKVPTYYYVICWLGSLYSEKLTEVLKMLPEATG